MAGKEERPYFKSSISQLERLFEQLKTNPDSLKFLDYELGFRTTNRAAKLRSRVAETLGGRTTLTREQSEVLTGTPVPQPVDLGELPQSQSLRIQTSQQPSSGHGPPWRRCLRKPTVDLKIWRLETEAVLSIYRPLAFPGRSENAHGRNDSFIIR